MTAAQSTWRSLARLTWRESRTMRSRLLLYMSSVSLGIGALVAIDSFSANVLASVSDSSRSLLGGDLALLSRMYSFEGEILIEAIIATFRHRETRIEAEPLGGRTHGLPQRGVLSDTEAGHHELTNRVGSHRDDTGPAGDRQQRPARVDHGR